MDMAWLGVGVDSSRVRTAKTDLDGFGRSAVGAERSAGRANSGMGLMARGAGAAAGALAALAIGAASVSAAIQTISQFEGSMSQVAAITRATGVELDALRATARDLGSTTEFSASQAADGLRFLGMAGFEASEAIAAIPAVLDLATASGMGLASAADTASNILSGFGLQAQNAGEVADVLAAASSRANTSVAQLGGAMSTVAPIAAALDISLSDTAAAIGIMSDAGIQGERAGTALRGVLASLAGPTEAAAGALAEYGIAVGDVDPATRSLADVMATLGDAGISTADAMTIFGREAASGALVLVDAADRVSEFGDELSNAGGEAERMADVMRDNLGGDINSLRSAVEGLIISLGDAGLTAIFRVAAQAVTLLTRGVTAFVDVIGTVTNAVAQFGADLFTLETAEDRLSAGMEAVELALDNSTIAMGDQIAQSARLAARLGDANVMTVEAARVNLASAQARIADYEAMERQNELAARQELGADDIARRIVMRTAALERARNNLSALDVEEMERYGDAVNSIEINTFRDLEAQVASLLDEQRAINQALGEMDFLSPEQEAAQAQSAANIEAIEAALAAAEGGMVSFGGEVVNGVELTARLSEVAGGIDMSNAIAGAQALSAELGVSLHQAMQVMGLVGAAAQREQQIHNPQFDVFDPRDGRHDSEEARLARAAAHMRDLAEEATYATGALAESLDRVGGGGGGSARGAADALDEATTYAEGLAEAFEGATMSAADMGREMGNSVVSGIDGVAGAWGDFVAGGFRDFEGFTQSVLRSFQSMLSDMIAQQARSGLMEIFSPGRSKTRGGGDLLGRLFAGFFDGGGHIPSGQVGMVGERGPELVRGPANVTSRADTARMMGGSQSLNVTVTMDQSTGALGAVVADIAGRVLAQAKPSLVQEAAAAGHSTTIRSLQQTRRGVNY